MSIKELRELTGLSQSKFAEKYNISVRTLQSWEAGKRTPPPHVTASLERLIKEDRKEEGAGRIKKHFTEVICTTGGQGFTEGDIYALGEATNNALYVLSMDSKGDPVNFAVHNYSEEELRPVSGEESPVFNVIK